MKTCGEIVKELRARCKLSRKEFANQLGLKSSNAICMIENGQRLPSIDVCYRIIDKASTVRMKLTLQDLRQREKW